MNWMIKSELTPALKGALEGVHKLTSRYTVTKDRTKTVKALEKISSEGQTILQLINEHKEGKKIKRKKKGLRSLHSDKDAWRQRALLGLKWHIRKMEAFNKLYHFNQKDVKPLKTSGDDDCNLLKQCIKSLEYAMKIFKTVDLSSHTDAYEEYEGVSSSDASSEGVFTQDRGFEGTPTQSGGSRLERGADETDIKPMLDHIPDTGIVFPVDLAYSSKLGYRYNVSVLVGITKKESQLFARLFYIKGLDGKGRDRSVFGPYSREEMDTVIKKIFKFKDKTFSNGNVAWIKFKKVFNSNFIKNDDSLRYKPCALGNSVNDAIRAWILDVLQRRDKVQLFTQLDAFGNKEMCSIEENRELGFVEKNGTDNQLFVDCKEFTEEKDYLNLVPSKISNEEEIEEDVGLVNIKSETLIETAGLPSTEVTS